VEAINILSSPKPSLSTLVDSLSLSVLLSTILCKKVPYFIHHDSTSLLATLPTTPTKNSTALWAVENLELQAYLAG
jgi:hypothetical protein